MNENPTTHLDFHEVVANKIRLARQEKGIDQESLAQVLDLTRTSIINIEKGRQRPSLYQVWLTARFLSIPLTELLPSFDLYDRTQDWMQKLVGLDEVKDEQDAKMVLGFISATKKGI